MTPPADVIAAARVAEQKWKIPASISIAQWALESGWGKHMPPNSNNPFGIKAVGNQKCVVCNTTEYVNGVATLQKASFRVFDSIGDAFDQHARLLATSPAYARAREYEANASAFANALTGVYATDPHYGSLLNNLIQSNDLTQYDVLGAQPGVVAPASTPIAPMTYSSRDGACINKLVDFASDSSQLDGVENTATRKLLDFDGEIYPSDGCAITLSLLLQQAGILVPDTFQALALANLLMKRGWQKIAVGDQQRGDIGSTCGDTPSHGSDHIYLVLLLLNGDEMVIADNQNREPHFRFASGKGKTPTRYFLRAPT